jgi:hypothetical protein
MPNFKDNNTKIKKNLGRPGCNSLDRLIIIHHASVHALETIPCPAAPHQLAEFAVYLISDYGFQMVEFYRLRHASVHALETIPYLVVLSLEVEIIY